MRCVVLSALLCIAVAPVSLGFTTCDYLELTIMGLSVDANSMLGDGTVRCYNHAMSPLAGDFQARGWIVDAASGQTVAADTSCASGCKGPTWTAAVNGTPSPDRCYRFRLWAWSATPQEAGSAQQCTPGGDPGGGGGGTDDQDDGCNGQPTPCGGSPIILNVVPGPYRLTSAADGVRFDLRDEGVKRQVAWTAPGTETSFLALDRNRNGRIDSGGELFGNYTTLRTGTRASHGFEALAELDDTADGVIDARDAIWGELLLWTDRNHDGGSTGDELSTVSEAKVTALGIASRVVSRRDEWGNVFAYMSFFRMGVQAGHDRPYYDVFLRVAN